MAQKVVSRLVEFYLVEHGRLNRTTGAPDFFANQAAAAQNRLAKAEERLEQVKNRTGIVSPENQRQLLAGRISRVEEELAKTAAAIAAAKARIAGYRERCLPSRPRRSPARSKATRTRDRPDAGPVLRTPDAGSGRRGQVHRCPSAAAADQGTDSRGIAVGVAGGADLDRSGAGEEEFDGVVGGDEPPMPMTGMFTARPAS